MQEPSEGSDTRSPTGRRVLIVSCVLLVVTILYVTGYYSCVERFGESVHFYTKHGVHSAEYIPPELMYTYGQNSEYVERFFAPMYGFDKIIRSDAWAIDGKGMRDKVETRNGPFPEGSRGEGMVENYRLQGKWVFDSGYQGKVVIHFDKGIYDGEWIAYDESGKEMSKVRFKEGKEVVE